MFIVHLVIMLSLGLHMQTFPGQMFDGMDPGVCHSHMMERRGSCSSGGRTPTGPFMHSHQQDPMLGKVYTVGNNTRLELQHVGGVG